MVFVDDLIVYEEIGVVFLLDFFDVVIDGLGEGGEFYVVYVGKFVQFYDGMIVWIFVRCGIQ